MSIIWRTHLLWFVFGFISGGFAVAVFFRISLHYMRKHNNNVIRIERVNMEDEEQDVTNVD